MASVRYLEFGNFWYFLSRFLAWDKIYVRILSFVKFGQVAAEIWRYNDFQNGSHPPCWLELAKFDTFIAKPLYACDCASSFQFRLNRTIWSRVIAKNWFSIWRPSAILNLGISEIFSFPLPRSNFAPAHKIASYSDDFQNGGRLACWIYCDVIILYRKTWV